MRLPPVQVRYLLLDIVLKSSAIMNQPRILEMNADSYVSVCGRANVSLVRSPDAAGSTNPMLSEIFRLDIGAPIRYNACYGRRLKLYIYGHS